MTVADGILLIWAGGYLIWVFGQLFEGMHIIAMSDHALDLEDSRIVFGSAIAGVRLSTAVLLIGSLIAICSAPLRDKSAAQNKDARRITVWLLATIGTTAFGLSAFWLWWSLTDGLETVASGAISTDPKLAAIGIGSLSTRFYWLGYTLIAAGVCQLPLATTD